MTQHTELIAATGNGPAPDGNAAAGTPRPLLSRLFFGAASTACRLEAMKLDFTAAVLDRIGDRIPYIGPATAQALGGAARAASAGYKTMLPALDSGHFPNPLEAISAVFNGLLDRVVDIVPQVVEEFRSRTPGTAQPQAAPAAP